MLAEIYGWFTEGFDTADLKDAEGAAASGARQIRVAQLLTLSPRLGGSSLGRACTGVLREITVYY
jgi:hypothetical protein